MPDGLCVGHIFRQIVVALALVATCLQGGTNASLVLAAPQFDRGANTLITLGSRGGLVPTNYLGLSVEADDLCQLLAADKAGGPAYEQILKNLGPGVLHIGGRSSDFSSWQPSKPASCDGKHPVIAPDEVRSLFNFVQRIGWKVDWGLPLARYNPANSASEAAYVESVAGHSLVGFSIGNEPDLYIKSGVRGPKWTYVEIFNQWLKVRAAVRKAVPDAVIIGPDDCCNPAYFASFAVDARDDVNALSFHYYAGEESSKVAAKYLMAPTTLYRLENRVNAFWHGSALEDHVPLYLSETNTFPAGGLAGVSDSFAAALWLTDTLFDGARLHLSQADIQESTGNNPYNPIDSSGQPKPLYYAMLLFHAVATPNMTFVSAHVDSKLNVTAYAVTDRTQHLRIVALNKSQSWARLEVNPGVPIKASRYYRLIAHGLNSTDGITLGGRAVSRKGTWSASTTPALVHSGIVFENMPPHSGIIVGFDLPAG